MIPDRRHQPETSCGGEAANVNPLCEFPVSKFKDDASNGKNYLKNKLEAQLEIQENDQLPREGR
jgi:hypothetical protein